MLLVVECRLCSYVDGACGCLLPVCCAQQGARHYNCRSLRSLRLLFSTESKQGDWVRVVNSPTKPPPPPPPPLFPLAPGDTCVWSKDASNSRKGSQTPPALVQRLHESCWDLGSFLCDVSFPESVADARWAGHIQQVSIYHNLIIW